MYRLKHVLLPPDCLQQLEENPVLQGVDQKEMLKLKETVFLVLPVQDGAAHNAQRSFPLEEGHRLQNPVPQRRFLCGKEGRHLVNQTFSFSF